jgi:uncharacterized glyoxalase superfamily protein PhnB
MPITPHIVVEDAKRAAAFYRDAFGADELSRIPLMLVPRSASRYRTCSGATAMANSTTRSGIAGTSFSTSATCRTTRSWPPPRRPSAASWA